MIILHIKSSMKIEIRISTMKNPDEQKKDEMLEKLQIKNYYDLG